MTKQIIASHLGIYATGQAKDFPRLAESEALKRWKELMERQS